MFQVPPASGCAKVSRAGRFTQNLDEMRKVEKEKKLEIMPCLILGDYITVGVDGIVSQPVLPQRKALGPVFKQDQVTGTFFNKRPSSSRK